MATVALSGIITPTNVVTATSTTTLTNKTLTGAIVNGTVGATTPATGAFTTVRATGNIGAISGAEPVAPFQAGSVTVIQEDANSGYVGANFGGGTSGTYIKSQFAVRTIYDSATGVIGFDTAPSGTLGNAVTFTRRATVNNAGDVGIGTSSPAEKLHISNGASTCQIRIAGQSRNMYLGQDATGAIVYSDGSVPMLFYTASTERARIDQSGNLLVGTTSVASGGGVICAVQSANSVASDIRATNASFSSSVMNLEATRNTTSSSYYFFSATITGVQTKIRIADSGNITNVNNSYGAISDAKLKTDIVDASSQWADIKAVKFRKFKMIDDPDQRVQLGVIAQEIEQVSAGLIEEHTDRDANDNDLGTTTKSVKTSVLLMKAAVALQEAMARIEQLEARLDAANL